MNETHNKRQGLLGPLVLKFPEESQEHWEGEELQQKIAEEGNSAEGEPRLQSSHQRLRGDFFFLFFLFKQTILLLGSANL